MLATFNEQFDRYVNDEPGARFQVAGNFDNGPLYRVIDTRPQDGKCPLVLETHRDVEGAVRVANSLNDADK